MPLEIQYFSLVIEYTVVNLLSPSTRYRVFAGANFSRKRKDLPDHLPQKPGRTKFKMITGELQGFGRKVEVQQLRRK